jgi:peptidoglycan/xylan/chitin deacetylase (PgdA/CDA1 family)
LEVAFTFDAGEGAGHTEEILDLLDENGIRGSFGVTGEWVEQNPDLTRRIVEDGHMLVNHTYDHSSFTGVSTGADPLPNDERLEQIEETRQIVLDVTGYETAPYFRFPYGDYDPESLDLLAQAGYDYTLWWSCDTQGWNGYSPETIADICGPDADEGGPGAILLMHVADDNDFDALPVLIEQYQEAGYAFVTMEELIQP